MDHNFKGTILNALALDKLITIVQTLQWHKEIAVTYGWDIIHIMRYMKNILNFHHLSDSGRDASNADNGIDFVCDLTKLYNALTHRGRVPIYASLK